MDGDVDARPLLEEVKLAFSKRSDGIFVFSTGIANHTQDFDDIENSLSLVVDFSRYARTLSRKTFYQSLKAQDLGDEVLGLAPCRNFNEWCISFKSTEAKDRFAAKEELSIEGLTGEIRECGVNYIHGKVYWLPLQFPQDRLAAVLGHFGELKRLRRDKAHEDGCGELYNGLRSFTLKLHENYKPEDLPHKCVIDNQECLLKISERPSLCFRCSRTGHDARFCPTNAKPRPNVQAQKSQAQRSVGEVLAPYNYTNKANDSKYTAIQHQDAGSAYTDIQLQAASPDSSPALNTPPAQSSSSAPSIKPVQRIEDSCSHQAKKSKPSSSWADEMEECDDLSEAESTASSGRSTESRAAANRVARLAFQRVPQVMELREALEDYNRCCDNIDAGKYASTLHGFTKCIAIDLANTAMEPPTSYVSFLQNRNIPSHIISTALGEAGEFALSKYRSLQLLLREVKPSHTQPTSNRRMMN